MDTIYAVEGFGEARCPLGASQKRRFLEGLQPLQTSLHE
jgi:hypothetical protein